jgi:adenylosuccinate lyase
VGLENVALWHERDISHSSAERFALPDACGTLNYMLEQFNTLVENLRVDTARMQANLDMTGGLVFSQAVLLELIDSGLSRDEAYRIVQNNAMATWENGGNLHDRLLADPDVTLPDDVLAVCFTVKRFLRNADVVFERLAGANLPG